MKALKEIVKYLVPIFVVIMFTLTLIFSFCLENSYQTNINSSLNAFEENWSVTVDDETYAAEFPFSLPKDKKSCIMTNTLPHVENNQILVLKYQYQDVTVSVGDEVIYTYETPTFGSIHTILGTNIISIRLKEEYSNQQIKLVMNGIKPTEPVSIEHMYLTTPGDFLLDIFKTNIPQLFISTLLITTSFIYLAFFIIFKIKHVKSDNVHEEYFLGLFFFSFTTGFWILTDLHLFYIATGYLVVNDILSYFSFMAIPIGFVPVIYFIIKKYKNVFWSMEYIYGANIILQTILFLTGAADLANMLIVSQILMGLGVVAVFVMVVLAVKKGLNFENLVLMIGFCIFGIFVLICLIGYVFGSIDFNYNIWFMLGMLVLALDFGFILIRNYTHLVVENASMDQTKKYAYTDALTGVGNRHAYEEALNEEKRKLSHYHFGIIGFDVNYLKESNDTLGHNAGDELLVACANIITKNFSTDGKNVFRTGGDEFSVIIELNHAELDAKLYGFLKDMNDWHGSMNEKLSVAYGAALMDDYKDLSLEELSMKADEKMYIKKREMHEKKNT